MFRQRNLKAFVYLALLFLLLSAIPGGSAKASGTQAGGFILLSAGRDGVIGTDDDFCTTEKGEIVRGKVDLAALGLTLADLIPSNVKIGDIVLAVSPQSAPADGKTAVTITAEVKDITGRPVPDGTEVAFLATLGTLSAASVPTSNGAAAVSLVSDKPGTSVVTAASGNAAAQASVEFYEPVISFSGGQATCSSYYSSHTADRAFDGNLSTWWAASTYSGWVQYEFSQPVAFSSAAIVTSVEPGTSGLNSGAETVTLKASMDGVSWTTLASKTQPYSRTMLYREFSFAFARVAAKYVRVEIARSADWVTVVETRLHY